MDTSYTVRVSFFYGANSGLAGLPLTGGRIDTDIELSAQMWKNAAGTVKKGALCDTKTEVLTGLNPDGTPNCRKTSGAGVAPSFAMEPKAGSTGDMWSPGVRKQVLGPTSRYKVCFLTAFRARIDGKRNNDHSTHACYIEVAGNNWVLTGDFEDINYPVCRAACLEH